MTKETTVEETVDGFKEGGIVGVIKIGPIKKSFAIELQDNLTAGEFKEVMKIMTMQLKLSIYGMDEL